MHRPPNVERFCRRGFILSVAGVLSAGTGARAAAPPAVLSFAAFRNGKRIGEHRMTFERSGDGLVARTVAEMAVKAGPLTLYRYRHEAVERWRGARFESLETRTNSNGKRESVGAAREAGGVVIRTGGGTPVTAPVGALPFTHWNPAIAAAPLFNPQTGQVLKQAARRVGESPVLLADGRSVTARRIAFTGDAQIDNWYDQADVWIGLRGRLEDSSTMEYRRL